VVARSEVIDVEPSATSDPPSDVSVLRKTASVQGCVAEPPPLFVTVYVVVSAWPAPTVAADAWTLEGVRSAADVDVAAASVAVCANAFVADTINAAAATAARAASLVL